MVGDEELKGLDAHIDAAITAAEAPDEIAAVEDTPAVETKADRGRDERGRFAPKTETAAAPEEVSEASPVESTEAPTAEAQPETPKFSDGHFKGWSPEDRAKFDKLPSEAQQFAVDLATKIEGRYTSKLMEAAEIRKTVEPVVSALMAERELFASQGMTPIQGFQAYANIEKTLTYGSYADKVNLISQICNRYGVPFAQAQPNDPFDPMQPGAEGYAAFHDQRAVLAREQAEKMALQRRLEDLERGQLQSVITSFHTATNADGTAKYPYYDTVKPAMAALLRDGKARTLEEAYAAAVQPIEALVTAQTARARQEAEARQQQAIEKAKRAAPARVSASAPSGKSRSQGLDAVIGSVLDSHGF